MHWDQPVTVDVRDECFFWAHQQAEHCDLLTQMFVAPGTGAMLAHEATKLGASWKRARDLLGTAPDPRQTVVPLLAQTLDFFRQILAILQAGTWLGWAPASLVDHMVEETLYVTTMISRQPPTLREITSWWMHHNAGEAALSAHLLDPSETRATQDSLQAALDFQLVSHALVGHPSPARTDHLFRRAAEQSYDLDGMIRTKLLPVPPQLLTTMPHTLAAHCEREVARYLRLYAMPVR